MPEKTSPVISSEGRERLNHPQNLYISLRPGDVNFDFATGIIYFFGQGNFLVGQIDFVTGELVYDLEAAESIRKHQVLVIYPQNAEDRDIILVQLCDRAPDGSQRQTNLFFRYNAAKHDWEPAPRFDSRVVDVRLAVRNNELDNYLSRLTGQS